MTALVIKDLPDALHQRLKRQARLHHRSMTKEAVTVLEAALMPAAPIELPPPVAVNKPLTDVMLIRAKEDGRA
jgi:plasmid stability protein